MPAASKRRPGWHTRPMRRLLPLCALVLLALPGCGGGNGATTTTAPATTAATTAAATSLKTYFFRDAALVPVTATVPATQAVARAALEALLAGAPPGTDTAIPAGTALEDVTVEGGVARAAFSRELGDPTRSAQAQIVSTLAQFPTVTGVEIGVHGKGAVPLQDGAGETIAGPATPADYVDLTAEAPIFVREPARDSTVSSPVHASGTADVFEATFAVDVWSGGRKLRTEVITASSGTGTRGTWSKTIDLPPGPAKLVFYEPSAEDGRPLHETTVELTAR
jgi:hypothetical protein